MTITNKFWVGGRKKNTELIFLDDRAHSLKKWAALKKIYLTLDCVGTLVPAFPLLTTYLVLVASYVFVFPYLPVCTSRCAPPLTRIYQSWDINLQRFTPVTQTLLLIPPNQ